MDARLLPPAAAGHNRLRSPVASAHGRLQLPQAREPTCPWHSLEGSRFLILLPWARGPEAAGSPTRAPQNIQSVRTGFAPTLQLSSAWFMLKAPESIGCSQVVVYLVCDNAMP